MSLRALHDLPAPAKINLFLHVIGRRADGYHLLQSVFALVDWCDTVHLARRDDGRLQRHDLGPALPADDLCLRAARALQQASGTALGADIHLDKRVPWGAGLGGGSSDAATVLLGLNRLWGLHWSRERLAALALPLGADVPFFIGGRNAWVEGIGERLQPIDLSPRRWLLLKPPIAVPTAAIFGSPLLGRDTKPATLLDFLADPSGFRHNDMQKPATAYSSQVQEAVALAARCGDHSRMTGSGSAVFAEIGSEAQMTRARQQLQALPDGWSGWLGRGLERHPLLDFAA